MKQNIILLILFSLIFAVSCKTTEKAKPVPKITKKIKVEKIKQVDEPIVTGSIVYITGKLLLNKDRSWSIVSERGVIYKLDNLPDNYKDHYLRVRIKGSEIEGNPKFINVLEVQEIF